MQPSTSSPKPTAVAKKIVAYISALSWGGADKVNPCVSDGHRALLTGCHRHPHAAQSMTGQRSPHRPIRQKQKVFNRG